MKALNNYIQSSITDAKTVVPALINAKSKLSVYYNEATHPKLRILDNLIFVCLATFFVQIVYMFVVGISKIYPNGTKEPLNALLAGCFCSLGQFALSASLRIQLSDKQYDQYSNKISIIEFMIASFLLYLSAFCLIN